MYRSKTGSRQFIQRWLEEHGASPDHIRDLFSNLKASGDHDAIVTSHDIVRVTRLDRDIFKVS